MISRRCVGAGRKKELDAVERVHGSVVKERFPLAIEGIGIGGISSSRRTSLGHR